MSRFDRITYRTISTIRKRKISSHISHLFPVKRKLNAEGEYDPSSPTSENNDETPAKKVALSSETETGDKQEIKPASPKKKTLPELEKYWKAVNEDPSDFTGWTYLLQYVDQEVSKKRMDVCLIFFFTFSEFNFRIGIVNHS